jgi:hypothetical protein
MRRVIDAAEQKYPASVVLLLGISSLITPKKSALFPERFDRDNHMIKRLSMKIHYLEAVAESN